MYSKAYCAAVQGIEGRMIQIEADISDGLPGFSLVGYLSSEVKEARERVRVALKNSGYRFPPRKITVNLSPADIRKDGTGYDLAIAVAVLTAYGYIPEKRTQQVMFIGELNLRGDVSPVSGVLPMVYTGREQGFSYCMLARGNQEEAAMVEGMQVIGISSLTEAVRILTSDSFGKRCLVRQAGKKQNKEKEYPDFADVRGQEMARRAAEVAASGMHHLLLIGPPGSGKSMIAARLPGILPSMTFEEQMEISRIYSVAGLLTEEEPFVTERPFRSPHHTITQTALAGGGVYPRPGELSLASGGVLFLDELPEFDTGTVEVLRQPLEEGWVSVARLHGSCRYPAKPLLLSAMNPCKCGWYPDQSRCHCNPQQIQRYLGRISRPILDRIDICTETVPISYGDLEWKKDPRPESSEQIRKRVEAAHQRQLERYRKEKFCHNAGLTPQTIKKYCQVSGEAEDYLRNIYEKMEFSARAYHKILKVGQSIADLEDCNRIEVRHVAEAVCYRSIDRKYWGREI